MEEELCKQEICKMAKSVFLYILGIILFIILLYIGMKLSKYKIKKVKIGGYILIVISTIGLFVDLYNVIHKYLI